jgi:hypothetical protein
MIEPRGDDAIYGGDEMLLLGLNNQLLQVYILLIFLSSLQIVEEQVLNQPN